LFIREVGCVYKFIHTDLYRKDGRFSYTFSDLSPCIGRVACSYIYDVIPVFPSLPIANAAGVVA